MKRVFARFPVRIAVAIAVLSLLVGSSILSASQDVGARVQAAPTSSSQTPANASGRGVPTTVPNLPATGLEGRWQVTGVPGGPWMFNFVTAGATLSGTAQQSGTPSGPVSIAGGRVEGTGLTFKVLSPDAERTVTFSGRFNGSEISFIREVTPLPGAGRGGNDLYGAVGPAEFIARRAGVNQFNFKGVDVDVASIQSSPNKETILESLRKQIEIVEASVTNPVQLAFLKSVPLVMGRTPGAAANNASYGGSAKTVTLQSLSYDADKPVVLHELMHAYHDQKLPNGFANADIQRLFQQARTSGQFPAGTYMLSNPAEYFAMVSSVYLYGSAARDPFTRQTLKEKQPDCFDFLVKEFGPR